MCCIMITSWFSLVIIGMQHLNYSVYEVKIVPPYTVKNLSRMPELRQDHRMEAFGNSFFIAGVTSFAKEEDNLNNVELYDLKKSEGRQFAPLAYIVIQMATVRWGDNGRTIPVSNPLTICLQEMYRVQYKYAHKLLDIFLNVYFA